jgi:1-deoxyxylulose-5-phosphate synthase
VPEEDVSRLVLGTAALGLPYGLGATGLIPEGDAAAVIRAALDAGVSTFDTAPAYGEAEARLGRALGDRGQVWTKVAGPEPVGSLEASLTRLRRARVDLLSWHNWTRSLTQDAGFRESWTALRAHPGVASLGATTYGKEDAVAAVESGLFDVVQVEWNLLRQGVLRRLPLTTRVAVRSVWLQGVLTPRGRVLPEGLRGLAPSIQRADALAREWGLGLEALALRAALDQPGVTWVVIGADAREPLDAALRTARAPRLTARQVAALAALDRGDDPLTDPRTWTART